MDTNLISQTSKFSAQSAAADALAASAGKLKGAAQSPDKVKKAAQDFEAFFVGQMMEYMSEGIKSDGVFGGGQAEETWRSMLNQEYGKQVAKSGRLGIANSVTAAMLQAQETRSNAARNAAAAGSTDSAPSDTSSETSDTLTNQAAAAAGTLARGKSVIA